MQKPYHTIVVGLGAMGSAALYQLAAEGKSVLGLDMHSPPHSLGSTHGGSRVTRQAYYEDTAYIPLLLKSYQLWRKLEQDSNRSILQITGGLMMSKPSLQIAEKSLHAAQKFSIPHEWLDNTELKKRYPQFRIEEEETEALLDKTAGILMPENAIHAHLELARLAGADIHLQTPMLEWKAEKGGVWVNTSKGQFTADHLVLCLGPWATPFASSLGKKLHIDRIVQFYMKPNSNISRYTPPSFPLFLWMVEAEMEFYGLPAVAAHNGAMKVAFYPYGPHPVRRLCTPDSIERQVGEQDEQYIRTYLERYLPEANHQCIKTSVCMHTNTREYHPCIGLHPQFPQVAYAFGFSGHGFKFSNVVGEILVDLLIGRSSPLQLDLFS